MRRLKWAGAMLVLVSVLCVPWGYSVSHEFFDLMTPPGSPPKRMSQVRAGPWTYLEHRFILREMNPRWRYALAASTRASFLAGMYSIQFCGGVRRNWALYFGQVTGALIWALTLIEWKKDEFEGMKNPRPSWPTCDPIRRSSGQVIPGVDGQRQVARSPLGQPEFGPRSFREVTWWSRGGSNARLLEGRSGRRTPSEDKLGLRRGAKSHFKGSSSLLAPLGARMLPRCGLSLLRFKHTSGAPQGESSQTHAERRAVGGRARRGARGGATHPSVSEISCGQPYVRALTAARPSPIIVAASRVSQSALARLGSVPGPREQGCSRKPERTVASRRRGHAPDN